jgi:hypothetical protein
MVLVLRTDVLGSSLNRISVRFLFCRLHIAIGKASFFLILLNPTRCLEMNTSCPMTTACRILLNTKRMLVLNLVVKVLVILIELMLDELNLVFFNLQITKPSLKLVLKT